MSGAIGRDELNKGRVEAAKVKRYRPGQAPEWMTTTEDDFELPGAKSKPSEPEPVRAGNSSSKITCIATWNITQFNSYQNWSNIDHRSTVTGVAAPVIVKKAAPIEDPRLARLAAAGPVDRSAARERHRDVAAPQIVRRHQASSEDANNDQLVAVQSVSIKEQPSKAEEDDEDAVAARRAALRQR